MDDGALAHGERIDPRARRSRERIVEAATTAFLERGYLDTNLQDVAARAGVVKRTVFNLYGTKEELFREVVAQAIATAERFAGEVVGHLGDGDPATELPPVAVRLARTVLGGRIVPLRRLVIGEVARFPELARNYYARAPDRVMGALTRAFERYADRGVLHIDDAQIAGEQFAFLVMGAPLDRALFDAAGDLADVEVERRARAGVDVFLRAHRTTPLS